MTVPQGEIERANPPQEGTGQNGPGLAGGQEGIERSGPPTGMSGGDTPLHSGTTNAQPDYPEATDPDTQTMPDDASGLG